VSGARLSSPIRAAVVTLSDKASAGLRADASGPLLVQLLRELGAVSRDAIVIPDDQPTIETTLIQLADAGDIDLVLTTGGTGLAPRDRTPEATLAVADRMAPGFAEAMRHASLSVTANAMLSRSTSAVRRSTLIINMPGSPKACREQFAVIAPVLEHAVETLRGEAFECATPGVQAPGIKS
jgi:molybdopterin adenylyltransferase